MHVFLRIEVDSKWSQSSVMANRRSPVNKAFSV